MGLWLSGCASTPQTRSLLDNPPTTLPSRVELTDTPFFPQEKYQCGPAALATVLVPLGKDVTPDDLVDEVYIPAREGSLQTEMRASIRKRGLLAVQLPGSLDALLREISDGRPVLVLQNLTFNWYPRWHYAVVMGYDLDERELVLRSGTTRRWVTPLSVFERTWARGQHWAIVAVPPGEVPATAERLEMLKATSALEQTGDPALALQSYRAVVERWPGDALARFSLANALMGTADTIAAELHYRRAIALNPEFAEAWNNLAYALHANGCRDQALTAARCAGTLAPGDTAITGTLEELRGLANQGPTGACEPLACPVGN